MTTEKSTEAEARQVLIGKLGSPSLVRAFTERGYYASLLRTGELVWFQTAGMLNDEWLELGMVLIDGHGSLADTTLPTMEIKRDQLVAVADLTENVKNYQRLKEQEPATAGKENTDDAKPS